MVTSSCFVAASAFGRFRSAPSPPSSFAEPLRKEWTPRFCFPLASTGCCSGDSAWVAAMAPLEARAWLLLHGKERLGRELAHPVERGECEDCASTFRTVAGEPRRCLLSVLSRTEQRLHLALNFRGP